MNEHIDNVIIKKCGELHCHEDGVLVMFRHWKGVQLDFRACDKHARYIKELMDNMLDKAEAYERLNNFQDLKP